MHFPFAFIIVAARVDAYCWLNNLLLNTKNYCRTQRTLKVDGMPIRNCQQISYDDASKKPKHLERNRALKKGKYIFFVVSKVTTDEVFYQISYVAIGGNEILNEEPPLSMQKPVLMYFLFGVLFVSKFGVTKNTNRFTTSEMYAFIDGKEMCTQRFKYLVVYYKSLVLPPSTETPYNCRKRLPTKKCHNHAQLYISLNNNRIKCKDTFVVKSLVENLFSLPIKSNLKTLVLLENNEHACKLIWCRSGDMEVFPFRGLFNSDGRKHRFSFYIFNTLLQRSSMRSVFYERWFSCSMTYKQPQFCKQLENALHFYVELESSSMSSSYLSPTPNTYHLENVDPEWHDHTRVTVATQNIKTTFSIVTRR